MALEMLSDLIATQRSRPLSVAVTVFALFVPASLTIFLSDPALFSSLGLNGVILLSLGISVPIVMLCYGLWYTPLSALWKAQRLFQGQAEPEDDLAKTLNAEDPLEWPCLLAGGWTANLVLYAIAAIAYTHPLRIGATFLLTAAILVVLWLVLGIASTVFYSAAERRWKPSSKRTNVRAP